MAKKRDSFNAADGLFEKSAPETRYAHDVHDIQDTQYAHDKQYVQDILESTRGRKGHKLPRINMAFTPDNHEFLKKASRRAGISITEYVNILVNKNREGKI